VPITDQETWDRQVKVNTDPYGKCAIDVAREVMRLLDLPEHEKFDADHLISLADEALNEGITGYQAGCIAQIVVHCHSRGEEFRASWNAKWHLGTRSTTTPPILTG
jgi:hypothetical protein